MKPRRWQAIRRDGSIAPRSRQSDTSRPAKNHGGEWCEDQILLARGLALEEPRLPLVERLARFFPSVETSNLESYLERMEVAAGHVLMRQDEPPDDLYLIESGKVTVQIELGEGQAARLLTLGAGPRSGRRSSTSAAPAPPR